MLADEEKAQYKARADAAAAEHAKLYPKVTNYKRYTLQPFISEGAVHAAGGCAHG